MIRKIIKGKQIKTRKRPEWEGEKGRKISVKESKENEKMKRKRKYNKEENNNKQESIKK